MKRKIFSKLLMVALVIAAVSSFVSCKDYDDDINNLQKQIDAKAAISQIESLQSQLTAAQSAAQAAATAAENALKEAQAKTTDAAVKTAIDEAIAKVNAAAEEAATKNADAIKAAADAAAAAKDDAAAAKAAADEAKTAAEKAYTDALEAIKAEIAKINIPDVSGFLTEAQVKKLIEDAAKAQGEVVTTTELTKQLDELKKTIPGAVDLTEINNAIESYDGAISALYSAVTSVSIWASHHDLNINSWTSGTYDNNGSYLGYTWVYYTSYSEPAITFIQVQEQENKFPTDAKKAEADNQYVFTDGKYVTYEDQLIIRVSPASATITPDMIELINSQGEAIPSDLIEISSVEPYKELMTRATDGNGLWVVTFKLKDGYSEDDLDAVAKAEVNNVVRNVIFAVAVNNTKKASADRRIVSEYDLTVGTQQANHAGPFTVTVGEDNPVSITNIHNRYSFTEAGDNTTGKEELVWKNETTNGEYTGFTTVVVDNNNPANTAANAYTRKNATDLGLTDSRKDNRQVRRFLYADVNEEIVITYPAARPLKGFYVTLDRDYAIESIPSEINAWDSYSYTNVGTKSTAAHMFEGNTGVISVNSEVANGDYIGFRVYAVNLDGTLVDPDGRAFYIHVGRLDDTAQTIAANVIADRVTPTSQVASTATFDNWNTNNVYYRWTIKDDATVFPYSTKPTINKINYVKADGTVETTSNWTAGSSYMYSYLTAAQTTNIKGITVEFDNIAQLYNNQTITLEAVAYKQVTVGGATQAMEIGIVTAQITKVMPEFPANLQGRAAQFTNANATDHFSGGTLNLFLLEDANDFTLASWTGNALNVGKCDLVSAFYNLDAADGIYDPANLTFSFAASDKNASNQLIPVEAVETAGAEPYTFPLSIKKAYINNTTEHNTTVTYNFGAVSTYIADDGSLKYAQNWTRNKAFTTIYDCLWDTKWMSYAWKENKAANTPSFTVGDAGKSIEFSSIYTKNTYNATVYGNDFKTITLDKFTTALTFTAVTLTSNETGKEDYFTCAFDDATTPTKINLTATEDWHNPVADVPSTLTIKYTDQFGHKETLTLPVTVKKQ